MKLRPIPETDLARIACLDGESRLAGLQSLKLGKPSISYDPVKKSLPDLMNVAAGPLGITPPVPWDRIKQQIIRACRSEDEQASNLGIAEALHKFTSEHEVAGSGQDFYPMTIGLHAKVRYWVNAALRIDGKPTILFIDPRRSRNLTTKARNFVFSVQHEHIRKSDLDFADFDLAVLSFGTRDGKLRIPKFHICDNNNLYSFEDLNKRVQETYDLWNSILLEREVEIRKTGNDRRGTLL